MKKLVFIAVTILLALSAMGPGYAGWSNKVGINQDIETGVLAVGVREVESQGCDINPDYLLELFPELAGCEPGGICCTAGPYLLDLNGRLYSEYLNISIINGFPGCTTRCTLELANGGTVPAALDNVHLYWEYSSGVDPQVEAWTIRLPDGYLETGRGFYNLQNALRHASLDPQETIRIEMQFIFPDAGEFAVYPYSSGFFKADYHAWNSDAWRK